MVDNVARERIALVAFGFTMGVMISAILFMWMMTLETLTMGLGRPI